MNKAYHEGGRAYLTSANETIKKEFKNGKCGETPEDIVDNITMFIHGMIGALDFVIEEKSGE